GPRVRVGPDRLTRQALQDRRPKTFPRQLTIVCASILTPPGRGCDFLTLPVFIGRRMATRPPTDPVGRVLLPALLGDVLGGIVKGSALDDRPEETVSADEFDVAVESFLVFKLASWIPADTRHEDHRDHSAPSVVACRSSTRW